MSYLSYRKERKRLLAEITKAKQLPPDPQKARLHETDLRVLDSDRLWQRAEWWGLSRSDLGPWEHDPETGRWWFPADQRFDEAKKQFAEGRYAVVKKWVDLLSPIASLVISILAFALAALALYLELIGRIQ
ncbi:MAG TPA: hypothetical protein VLL54_04530 [Pyrinomonadaceae bacterium]|nr:hypothetical protein [Pyrinomonadaceae bacterium]